MPLYFRVSDRRECPAHEALDARGVLRHGYGQRVPAHLRDGAPRFSTFWDANRDSLVVTDADATGSSGNRPGWRISDSPLNKRAIADAYRDHERHLNTAYQMRDERECPDCNGTGEIDGEDCERCEGTGELDDDNNGNGETPQGKRVRPVTADAMNSAHQKNMARIYDQIAVDLSQQYRRGK